MLDNITSAATPGKTPTHRKINKLMMEKRRRTRINNCLSELKTLVLKALKKDGEQFSKLEKVDILEMTVKYLRFLHQQQQVNLTTDSLGNKYRVPLDISAEVMRYMNSDETRSRLTDHITKCVRVSNVGAASVAQNLSNVAPGPAHPSSTSSTAAAATTTLSVAVPHQQQHQHQHQMNNGSPQSNERAHANHHHHHTSPFVDKPSAAHIMLPIATKQSENSFLLAAASSDTTYKTVALSYTPATSDSPLTNTNPPITSVTALSPAVSPSILHMKALVPDNSVSTGNCYLSTLPVYVSSIGQLATPNAANVAGFYTQQIKRNPSPDPSKILPLWRPW